MSRTPASFPFAAANHRPAFVRTSGRARRWLPFIAVWLTGCTALAPSYVHRDGERHGKVTMIGNDARIIERLADTCPPPDGKAIYALIRYTGNDHLRWRAFPLPPGSEIDVGDRVLLDVNACRFTKME